MAIAIGGALGLYKDVKGQSRFTKEGQMINVYEVEQDPQKWVLGYEALDSLKLPAITVANRDGLARYKQAQYAIYSKIGLVEGVCDRTPAQILLVTSTPAKDYLDKRVVEQLDKLFRYVHQVTKNGERKVLNVVKYEPMSETEAILYDFYLNQQGGVEDESFENTDVLVINPGFGTTDLSYYNDLEYRPLERETVKVSFLNVVQLCKNHLTEFVGREITTQEVAMNLSLQKLSDKKVFVYAGEDYDYTDVYKKSVDIVFAQLSADLSIIVEDPDRISKIIVGGGAANDSIWGKHFRNWSRRVSIPEQPEFSPLRGMYNYANYVRKEMNEPTLFIVVMDTGNGEIKIMSDAMLDGGGAQSSGEIKVLSDATE